MLEAGHIVREVRRARVAIAGIGGTIVVAVVGRVEQDLEILVAVLHLLGLEVEGHVKLHVAGREVVLGRSDVVVAGACHGQVGVVAITAIARSGFGGRDRHRFLVEIRRENCVLGVVVHFAVIVGQHIAVLVEYLETVDARGAGLEAVVRLDVGDVRFRDVDGFGGLVGREGHRAGLLGEVLSREGREADGAVVHRFGDGGVARAGDGEGGRVYGCR